MPDSLHLAKQSLSYAKLVATPTDTSWSQVYNAGNLFACLSLSQEIASEENAIAVTGKAILNNLEAEFFTLEEKSLESIKKAIAESIKDLPEDIKISFSLAFFKDTVLYLFIAGTGKIILKRGEAIGILLEQKNADIKNIVSASGKIHNNDCLILQTQQFAQNILPETLTAALEVTLPNDIAESLSPQLHEHDDGGQAAIIIVAQGIAPQEVTPTQLNPQEETLADAIREEAVYEQLHVPTEVQSEKQKRSFSFPKLPTITLPKLPFLRQSNVSSKRKVTLILTILLVLFLLGSIAFTKYNQDQAKKQTHFKETYASAERSYEEGKALTNLNPELSREDFQKAQTTITQAKKDFTKSSSEDKKFDELLRKVQSELDGTGGTDEQGAAVNSTAKQADTDASPLLSSEKTGDAASFAQDDTQIYALTQKGITAINKSTKKSKTIITNEKDWESAVALAPYQGNIYVLDPQNGVLKFVSGGDGFGKTDYFKENAPNLNTAVAMAIDSDVWILTKNGGILKYTSGKSDSFKISGLDKPLAQPNKIITTKDMTNVYILDRGNRRIVALSKSGAFQKQYAAEIIAQAKDFDVVEKDKKILILSGNKIWEIPME